MESWWPIPAGGWVLSLGGTQRRQQGSLGCFQEAPKGDESLLIPAGSPKEPETASNSSCAGGRKGSLLPAQLPPICPLFFLPSLSHFLHVSKLSVMRPTCLQENAVHLLKSLLESILKQK